MSYKRSLYEEYFSGLKTAINSLNGAIVVESRRIGTVFPCVEMVSLSYGLTDETMGKEQQYIDFGYEINIFATDTETKLGEVIVEEIEELVIDYFNTKGFTYDSPRVRNIDETVSRRLVRVSAVYDTQKNIVYRG